MVWGSGVNVTSVHADDGERCYHKRELSACMRLTPQTKTLQRNSNRALKNLRGRKQEVLSTQTDFSRVAWEGMGCARLAAPLWEATTTEHL